MPLANSRRPTIWPKRPKPAISTAPSAASSMVSASCFCLAARRSARRSWTTSSSGVQAIDSATAMVSRPPVSRSSKLAPCAAANTTKANSPPCESNRANSPRWRGVMPMTLASSHSSAVLIARKPTSNRATLPGRASSKPKSIAMPTEMKNRPSKSPLNGSMSVSRAWRYSELASSTPARKAPSAMERPTSDISCDMPSTSSRAKAVNTSRVSAEAISRSAGRVR